MKSRKQKASSEGEGGGVPGWMVTYGDMMSLLLCFFVLILSFSSVEISKFKKAMGSLKGALGIMSTDTGSSTSRSFPQQMQNAKEAEEALEEMEETFKKLDVEESVKWEVTPEGIHIVINDPVLFDLGKADLKPEVFPVLQAITKVIETQNPAEIEVQGHTDDLPINTPKYPSNWELSAARALNVVKFFAYEGHVEPRKLSASGYGEYRPTYINTSRDRPKNRRVEIFLKRGVSLD